MRTRIRSSRDNLSKMKTQSKSKKVIPAATYNKIAGMIIAKQN